MTACVSLSTFAITLQIHPQESGLDAQGETHALARERLLTEDQLGIQRERLTGRPALGRRQLEPGGLGDRVPMARSRLAGFAHRSTGRDLVGLFLTVPRRNGQMHCAR
jgi:hypothetical protein